MFNFLVMLGVFLIALLNYGCASRPQMLLDFTTGKEEFRSTDPLFNDPAKGMEMIFVKGGCYQMGDVFNSGDDPSEKPVHEACVDDFYIGKYEVTQGQWKTIMGSTTLQISPGLSGGENCLNCPVGNVSWVEVQEFIGRLNGRAGGSKFRLPTEAEWEYAARSGGKNEQYSGGNDVAKVAWYDENARSGINMMLHPVGTKAPNGLGIYDMSGNVWEMTGDWYDEHYYAVSPRSNPAGPDKPANEDLVRVRRGGGASAGSLNHRTSRRGKFSLRYNDTSWSLGFRLARITEPVK